MPIQQEAQNDSNKTSPPAMELDEDGFLINPKHWSRQIARALAEMEDLEDLGADHWAIIYYLREHHLTYGSLPPMSQVCRTRDLDSHAVGRLFGGCRQAWRIAGLPNPGGEAISHMD